MYFYLPNITDPMYIQYKMNRNNLQMNNAHIDTQSHISDNT
jgi:hypothetical protein